MNTDHQQHNIRMATNVTGNSHQHRRLSSPQIAITTNNDNNNNNNMDLMNEKTKIFCERISQVYDRLRNDFKQMRLSAQSTTNTVDNKG